MSETSGNVVHERQPIADVSLRRLDPENPQDLTLARAIDGQSLEAVRAFAHDEYPDPHAFAHSCASLRRLQGKSGKSGLWDLSTFIGNR